MKQGNQHSSLLDALVKTASTDNKPTEDTLASKLLGQIKAQNEQRSLKEVIAQMDPAMSGPMDSDMEGPLPEDMMSDEMSPEEGALDSGPDTQGAVQALVDALIALKGSPEEAHAAIDECSGSPEGPEEMDMGEPGLGEETEALPEEVPAPMEMGGPSPMPAPMQMPM